MKFIVVLTVLLYVGFSHSTILDRLKDDPDLSQFYSMLERDVVAQSTVNLRSCTLFAPTNQAFQKHPGNASLLYHMATIAQNKEQLQKTVPSDMEGNPPIYVTRTHHGDIFINNAKLIPTRTIEERNMYNKRQVLHVIDEVLSPLTPNAHSKIELANPDAYQFLTQADALNIGQHRLRVYKNQVSLMKKEQLYQSPGRHTFLIPVDESFKTTTRSNLVDNKVIDGHVVPNNVIFTALANAEHQLTSAAFGDNLKVTITFFPEKNGKVYVKSITKLGDSKHTQGGVLAEIVKANIPVANGVVHLIDRPLMIVDTTVKQFLMDKENSALNKFYEVIMDMGGDVLEDITKLNEVTILAPSNEAWAAMNVQNVIRNRQRIREILNMHVIKDRLSTEKIRAKNTNQLAQVPTVNGRTFLYFNVKDDGHNGGTITVEGGGVNATIIQSDIAQTNGFVHIIDKVLGVPYTTILGKLETDPMLSDSYKMGIYSGFNEQLNNTQQRYTYFVVRNQGWEEFAIKYPSAHKKLFMQSYSYHSKLLLERHLVIADNVYTMNDLLQSTNQLGDSKEKILLPSYRGALNIRVTEEIGQFQDVDGHVHEWPGYYIYWNFKKIPVFRPDVECVNGVIHVLDEPIIDEKDIVVSGSRGIYSQAQLPLGILTNFVITVMVAKLFLL